MEVKPRPEGGKPNDDSKAKQEISVNFPPAINANVSGHLEVKAETTNTNKHEQWHSNPDFYVALFTGLLVAVTAALAIYTWKLWRATKKLVDDAKDTGEKQLRAYVGHNTSGFSYDEFGKPRITFRNYGATPASELTIYVTGAAGNVGNVEGNYPHESGKCTVIHGQMLQPGQEFPFLVENPPLSKSEIFSLWGYVEYRDIHKRKWRNRFSVYTRNSEGWYNPREKHNNEIEIT